MKIMTMDQFLKQPNNKYASSFARRDLIIQNLEDRFARLMNKRKEDFKVIIFNGKDKNQFIFYFKIPSEDIPKLTYDVVLKFIPTTLGCVSNPTLKQYAINVFSNSPNFIYTYAYVYNKDEIVVKELKDKLSKQALEEEPKIKNVNLDYGFEKSVYFALLYMKYNNLDKKMTIKSFLQPTYNFTKIKPMIKNSNSKMIEYTALKKQYKLEEKEKLNKIKKDAKRNKNTKFTF